MKKTYLIILFSSSLPVFAQEPDPYHVLELVKNKYDRITDYTVNAEIIVDIDLIKIPEKNAIVYYKAPDKYRFKSEGFIMIPKKGLNFSILELISNPFTAIYDGTIELNGKNVHELKIIPKDRNGDLVLATLWIDSLSSFIERVEANTRRSGSYVIDLKYDRKSSLPLPDEIRITFEVEKLRFPLKFIGNVNIDTPVSEMPDQATVTIKYTEYKVNTGLKDEIFNENPQRP